MSDANPTADDTADADGSTGDRTETSSPVGTGPTGTSPDAEDADTGSKLVTYVEYAAFGILCLLALVATFRFYFAASEAIRVWFSSDFVPVFQAVFNLVVLILSVLGISLLVRRIA